MSRTPKSIVKPWDSTLVFFDKNARADALGPGMVRVKATIDHRWTMNLKKNYQQNNVVLELLQDNVAPDGRITSVTHSININGKYFEPEPETTSPRYYDIAKFILISKGIADKYSNLLDVDGNVVASKQQQIRWSGAPGAKPFAPRKSKPGASGNIQEIKLTKKSLYKLISEEYDHLQELAPAKGVMAVDDVAIAEAERLEKMYRNAGLTDKADQIRKAIAAALAGEVNITQFHDMYEE